MGDRIPSSCVRCPSAALIASILLFTGCGGKTLARAATDVTEGGNTTATGAPARQERTGIYHVLLRGQTLYSVSRAYQVPLGTLAEANGVTDPTHIPASTPIFVPGATHPLDVPIPGSPVLAWPVNGKVTSGFGVEGGRPHHEGIDIDGVQGQEVRAAAGGRVVWAGTERGYGKMVVIDHGRGVATLYAHASKLLVETDEPIVRGQPIAEVGRSGNARGVHLHFEVRRDGRPIDPLPLLRDGALRATTSPRTPLSPPQKTE